MFIKNKLGDRMIRILLPNLKQQKKDDLGCKYRSVSFDIRTRAWLHNLSLFGFERVEQSRSFKLYVLRVSQE